MGEEDRAAPAPQGAEQPTQDADAPFLPASFFAKLVRQPSCITRGVCDNCGRCEH